MSMEKFDGLYLEWNEKRLAAILKHYGVGFFANKTILTLGCGYGAISYELQKLGAEVTYVDGRQDHVDFISRRDPDSIALCMNLDEEWPEGRWDILVHFGLLYHLKYPEESLLKSCAAAEHLILETEVVDSKSPTYRKSVGERKNHYTQSLDGTGVRLSPARVEQILTAHGMEYSRLWDNSCNAGIHKYDWKPKGNNAWNPGQRRFWFAKRK